MGIADLHVHSIYSHDGICTIPNILHHAANYTDLDVIAITDHDQIDGALEAEQLSPRYGIEVVPGIEVTAREGHVLALFVRQPIRAGLPLAETVMRAGELGGICVVAHPLARGVDGVSERVLRSALRDPDVARHLIGVETCNAGLVFRSSNFAALKMAKGMSVAQTGGSDSHVLFTIGQGVTHFSGRTAADLRAALEQRATRGELRQYPNMLRFLAIWLPGRARRRVTWAPVRAASA